MFIDDLLARIKGLVNKTDYWWAITGIMSTLILWKQLNPKIKLILILFLIVLLLSATYAKDPKRLCYTQRSVGITIKDLQINGKSYKELTLTQIAIWNAGSKKIDGDKIDATKPLKIKLTSPDKIIDLDILYHLEKKPNLNV
ncbi:MAG: hypothetical protein H0X31_12380 [Nostocaceae cyanobacterium]|nr:hypothetical protein [Nostocaceae cyanobacterium]